MTDNKVLVIGLGNLARKLIAEISCTTMASGIVVVTRNSEASTWCAIASLTFGTPIRTEIGDALDEQFLSRVMREHQPRLVVNAAALLSPFAFDHHPLQEVSAKAGFAMQLPAQLPVALSVLRVARTIAPDAVVINCCFPDVVNPILSRLGIAPDTGLGNAGIVHFLIEQALAGKADASPAKVQVIAHHAHAISLLKGAEKPGLPDPLVYVDGTKRDWHLIKPVFSRPLTGEEINILTAASARALLRSLVNDAVSCTTSAAGPLGLEGGQPIAIGSRQITLDHPPGSDSHDVTKFLHRCATFDGIDRIDADGTVYFTDNYITTVAPYCPVLCEPLRPAAALSRFEELKRLLRLPANSPGVSNAA